MGWHDVDAGSDWLIFALPPAEMEVHPGDTTKHELLLMRDHVETTMAELRKKESSEPQDVGFGVATTMLLPGGVEVLLYEPHHLHGHLMGPPDHPISGPNARIGQPPIAAHRVRVRTSGSARAAERCRGVVLCAQSLAVIESRNEGDS